MHVANVCGALAGELARNTLWDLGEGGGSEEEQHEQASNHGRSIKHIHPRSRKGKKIRTGAGKRYDK